MLFCLLMMGMTATVCHMLRQRKRPLPPKVVKIVFAAQCLGLLLCLLDQLGRQDGRGRIVDEEIIVTARVRLVLGLHAAQHQPIVAAVAVPVGQRQQ